MMCCRNQRARRRSCLLLLSSIAAVAPAACGTSGGREDAPAAPPPAASPPTALPPLGSSAPASILTSAWIDVRTAGAVGDGVAEDTAAILRAIASLPAAGGTVHFPPGRYLTLQQKIVINRSHVRLEGSPGAAIRGKPGAWESAVLIQVQVTPKDHLTDVIITGLEFDGNQAAHKLQRPTQAHLLEIQNADRVVVRDNYFHDSPGDAIKISPRTTVCRLISLHRNRIDTCLRNGISVVA